MSWTVIRRYASLPGEQKQSLVRLDVVAGDRVICGIPIRPPHDEAWHLKIAHQIAAAPELEHACRCVLMGVLNASEKAEAALRKAGGRS